MACKWRSQAAVVQPVVELAALERLLAQQPEVVLAQRQGRKAVLAQVALPAWATEAAVRAALELRVVRAVASKAADPAVVAVAAPKDVATATVMVSAVEQTIEAMATTASS